MDYRKTAKEILNHVGGSKSIVSAANCATRLRLVIADNTKADKTALENVDGGKGVFEASGQLQIILGTGLVNRIYDEVVKVTGTGDEEKSEEKEKVVYGNKFQRAIRMFSDVFVPFIPVLESTGLFM